METITLSLDFRMIPDAISGDSTTNEFCGIRFLPECEVYALDLPALAVVPCSDLVCEALDSAHAAVLFTEIPRTITA